MSAGLIEEARLASTFSPVSYETLFGEPYPFDLPPGWSHLDSGSYRTVFLSPSGWVYKIDNFPWRSDNLSEFRNYIRCMADKIKGWVLPKTQLYMFGAIAVICMQYIAGEHDQDNGEFTFWKDDWELPQEVWGLNDWKSDNVLVMEDGTKAIVDLAN